jgi:hypothetical protein
MSNSSTLPLTPPTVPALDQKMIILSGSPAKAGRRPSLARRRSLGKDASEENLRRDVIFDVPVPEIREMMSQGMGGAAIDA